MITEDIRCPAWRWQGSCRSAPGRSRTRSTLVLVHRQPLLDQWVAQLSMFLGIDTTAIGRLGGGKRAPNGHLDVAMLQSLVRGGAVSDIVAIVDECHHVPAVSFERVLCNVKAKYVTGLTATPQRRDGHQPIIEMQLGPVRFAVESKSQAAQRPLRSAGAAVDLPEPLGPARTPTVGGFGREAVFWAPASHGDAHAVGVLAREFLVSKKARLGQPLDRSVVAGVPTPTPQGRPLSVVRSTASAIAW